MDHGEIHAFNGGNGNARDALGGRRERWEEREGQMPNGVAKFGTVGSVPGVDRIELF